MADPLACVIATADPLIHAYLTEIVEESGYFVRGQVFDLTELTRSGPGWRPSVVLVDAALIAAPEDVADILACSRDARVVLFTTGEDVEAARAGLGSDLDVVALDGIERCLRVA